MRWALNAALCALTAASSAAQAQPGLDPFLQRLLAAHNRERAAVGVPPLTWDPILAASARSYGPTLEAIGRLQHSPRASRPGQRENLWMGSKGYFTPEQMIGSWSAEKRFYRPGLFPGVSTTGNWIDVAHYTQMVWRTTTRVGCGIYRGVRMDWLICRYSPPGNIDNKPVF